MKLARERREKNQDNLTAVLAAREREQMLRARNHGAIKEKNRPKHQMDGCEITRINDEYFSYY